MTKLTLDQMAIDEHFDAHVAKVAAQLRHLPDFDHYPDEVKQALVDTYM